MCGIAEPINYVVLKAIMSGTWRQSKVLRWHRYLQNKVNVRKVAKFLLCRYKSARNLFYAEIKLNKQGPRFVAYVVSLMLNSLVLDFTFINII